MRVEWTPAARRAAFRIFCWIARENPWAAREVYSAIFSTADSLEHLPWRHRVRSGEHRRIPVAGYPVYYISYRIAARRAGHVVIIEGVRHGAQDHRPT